MAFDVSVMIALQGVRCFTDDSAKRRSTFQWGGWKQQMKSNLHVVQKNMKLFDLKNALLQMGREGPLAVYKYPVPFLSA